MQLFQLAFKCDPFFSSWHSSKIQMQLYCLNVPPSKTHILISLTLESPCTYLDMISQGIIKPKLFMMPLKQQLLMICLSFAGPFYCGVVYFSYSTGQTQTVQRHIDISRARLESERKNIFPLCKTIKCKCEGSPRARPCFRLHILLQSSIVVL